jgi:hypothetical protein
VAKGVAGQRLESMEYRFGALPQLPRGIVAIRLARDVIACSTAPKREAAVSSTCALGDPARVVDADAETRPSEGECAGTPRHTGADHRDINPIERP